MTTILNTWRTGLYAGAFFLASVFASGAAQAAYTYVHSEGEYAITLPDAPRAVTLWADNKDIKIPFLEKPPLYGSVGENAIFKRVDAERGDLFEANIIFLKADPAFLQKQTEASMTHMLRDYMSEETLERQKISDSAGTGTLKWATLTGYALDAQNNLFFVGTHLLTGTNSLLFVRIRHSAENKDFTENYKQIISSIKFIGK